MKPGRTFGYIRVSTEEQAEEGHSLDGQDRYIRVWCEEEGWPEPTQVYREEGLSGSDTERPGLNALLVSLKPGDLVLCVHPDRLSRDQIHLLTILREFKQKGIDIRFGLFGPEFDPLTDVGMLVTGIIAGLSEFFLKDAKRKSRLGIEQAHVEGVKFGRMPRFFRVIGDHLEPAPELLKMYETRRDTGLTETARRFKVHKRQVTRSLQLLKAWEGRESPWLLSKERRLALKEQTSQNAL